MNKRVVIVGAGQAGAQVAASLRDLRFDGAITLVGDEPHIPYQRPPLSKAFLKGSVGRERLYLWPSSFYADRDIRLATGSRALGIDIKDRTLVCEDGSAHAYDALVLATGTRPRRPVFPGSTLATVVSIRSIADIEDLQPKLDAADRIAIIGGGYIGLEVAAVLRTLGKCVTIVEAANRILQRVTSSPVSSYFEALHRSHGVDIVTGVRVDGIAGEAGPTAVRLAGGASVPADLVLVAVGAEPNVDLAAACGIAIDDGVVVDRFGMTSAPGIFACGDCARFPSSRYGASVRVESVQNAIDHAKCVARNIAAEPAPYDPVPWFWSDQFDTKLQIAGLINAHDDYSVIQGSSADSFAVEYRRKGRLIAVDAVNNARAHMLARRRIADDTHIADPSRPAELQPQ